MRIGVPTEIKDNEFRVALTPAGVDALIRRGHEVSIQTGAGRGSAIGDEDYARAGAELVEEPRRLWEWADLIVKVKEPVAAEYPLLRPGLLLFTFLHLAESFFTNTKIIFYIFC